MRNRPWIVPVVIGVLVLSTLVAAGSLIGALGRISVMMAQADTAEVVTAAALAGEIEARAGEATALLGEAEARMALAASFEEAAQEEADATIREAEARATLIVQEAEGEAAFRRLTGYLETKGDLVGVRLAEEMDGEVRVQGMLADQALDVSASSLLIAQARIGTLEVRVIAQDSARAVTLVRSAETEAAHARTNAAHAAEISIKDQIIEEQQNVIAPSFIRKIFDMPEVAAAGVVVGAGLCLAFCP